MGRTKALGPKPTYRVEPGYRRITPPFDGSIGCGQFRQSCHLRPVSDPKYIPCNNPSDIYICNIHQLVKDMNFFAHLSAGSPSEAVHNVMELMRFIGSKIHTFDWRDGHVTPEPRHLWYLDQNKCKQWGGRCVFNGKGSKLCDSDWSNGYSCLMSAVDKGSTYILQDTNARDRIIPYISPFNYLVSVLDHGYNWLHTNRPDPPLRVSEVVIIFRLLR